MTPENKKKLQDAFNAAVNASPYADETVEGIVTHDGRDVTRRQLVDWTLKNEEFYKQVDALVDSGKLTIDQFITKFEDGMKKSIQRGPRP